MKSEIIVFVIVSVISIMLGIAGTIVFFDITQTRVLNGLYINGAFSEENAMQFAKKKDFLGEWVCINVAYDMSPDKAYETCIHECSHSAFHEIWATKCEKNVTKCLDIIK